MKKFSFLTVLILLTASLALAYFFPRLIKDARPSHPLAQNRFQHILENMDEITRNSDQKTLFVGTSIFQYFLDPRVYDDELQKRRISSKSYNLGIEGNVGSGFYTFLQRLKLEFGKRHAKFKRIVIEFSPACHNQTYYRNHQILIDITHPGIFMDQSSWLKMLFENPPSATFLLSSQVTPPLDWEEVIPYQEILGISKKKNSWAGVAAFWSSKTFQEVPEWNPGTRGLMNWNLPKSEEAFDQMIKSMHEKKNWDDMIMKYRRGNGIFSFYSYDPNLVNFFIEGVRVAQDLAENVDLVILPYAPSFQKYVDQYVDYNYLINRIQNETNAKVIDLHQTIPATDEDFADAMHLKKEYMSKYLKILATEFTD